LKISFEDEKDPTLLKVKDIPESVPAYQKVLFNGLFVQGDKVSVSSLKNKYYAQVDQAKTLISAKKKMKNRYEKKSVVAVIGCAVLSLVALVLAPFIIGTKTISATYVYLPVFSLVVTGIMLAGTALCLFGAEEVRFKGKGGKRKGLLLVAVLLSALGIFLGTIISSHVTTELERGLLHACAFVATWLGVLSLTRTKEHCETLGDILGFKEFIVVTEEDKIKFMLQENPQAYYHILPYAQVLGVTNEWEKKFEKITLEPPTWYVGEFTFFDYYILTRSMRVMSLSMHARPQQSVGGIGRSGGGGGFGGFSGGGHGGGGFGVR
jgi:hypothetical protein